MNKKALQGNSGELCQRSVSKKNGERGEEILKKFVNGWLDTGLLWFSAVLIPVWLMVIFKTAMSEPDVVYCMSDIYSYAHEKGLIIFLSTILNMKCVRRCWCVKKA